MVELDPDAVAAICHSCLVRASSLEGPPENCITLVESLSMSAAVIPDCCASESLSLLDLREKQRADPSFREVIHQLKTGEDVPSMVQKELSDLGLLLRERNRLELQDDILYRRRQDGRHLS